MSLQELVTTLEVDHQERAALAESLALWQVRVVLSYNISVSEIANMIVRHETEYVLPRFAHEWKVEL